jgi:hypothetical protein
MNRVQRNYIVSRAALEAIEAVMAEKELQFLRSKGRTENHVWAIEDEAVFDLLNVEFCVSIEDIDADYEAARLALRAAENALIEYALSITPDKIRETLRQGSNTQTAIRKKMINVVMKLDTSTVPA